MKVILASQSPYRKELLSRIIDNFECIPSDYDESVLKAKNLPHEELSIELSYGKAKSVFKTNQGSIVIGSDQVCSFKDKVLSKPGSKEKAAEVLSLLAGQTHSLITSYVIMYQDQVVKHTDITRLSMRELTTREISDYLEVDTPYDCAGSYKLEKKGVGLFKKIEAQDHTSIIGLPLIQLNLDLLAIFKKIS